MDKLLTKQLSRISISDLHSMRACINKELLIRKLNQEKEDKYQKSLNKVEEFANHTNELLSIPRLGKKKPETLAHYLPQLLQQNWSHLYPCEQEIGPYYVYAHLNPKGANFITSSDAGGEYGGEPIYIGKGIGNRAYDLKRNQGHGVILRQIIDAGAKKEDIVKIIFDGYSEARAYEAEAKLIYFFGTVYDSSRRWGLLYNLDIPKIPEFVDIMPVQKVKPKRNHWKEI